ncbi:hypothetical protein ACT6QH_12685 [Xanthobacter sp. TB0139]|uniref:hypothetical protein n=1 Tax=Xanthobacter sp. TB0139 TaxID=3459178 RepID=UPI004039482F
MAAKVISKQVGRGVGAWFLAGLMPFSTAWAAEQYMAKGAPFFPPYRTAIVTFDVQEDGHIRGTLASPKGDPRSALQLKGKRDGSVMELTIGKGGEEVHLKLLRSERDGQEVWGEADYIPGVEDVVLFRPQAGFSDAGRAIQHINDDWCGVLVGGLSVTLHATSLRSMDEPPPDLEALNVVLSSSDGELHTAKMKALWDRLRLAALGGKDVRLDIAVPVGSEAGVAEAVRGLPAVVAVGLPNNCREMALVSVPRPRIMDGDTISDTKLKTYLEEVLARQLSGGDPEEEASGKQRYALAGAKVERNANNQPVFTATLTVGAEVTGLEKGMWSRFQLAVQPVVTAVDTAETISLLVTVSNVAEAQGKKTRHAPVPAAEDFKPQESAEEAAALSQKIVSWLAQAEKTHCSFVSAAYHEDAEDNQSCTNPVRDDLAPLSGE